MSGERPGARRWQALLPALACVATLAAPLGGPTGNPIMNEAQTRALEFLKLPDAGWFGLDGAARLAMQMRLASSIAPSAALPNAAPQPVAAVLAVGAPAQVAPQQRERVPFLVAAQFDARREWEVNYKPNRVVVASDLSTGRVKVGSASPHDKRRPPPPSRTGAPPSPQQAMDAMTSLELLNLVDLTGPLQGPTRLALTVLYFDWRSNTVSIDVTGPGQPPAGATQRTAGVARQADPRTSLKPGAPAGVAFSLAAAGANASPLAMRVMINLPLHEAGLLPGPGPAQLDLVPVTALLVQRDVQPTLQFDTGVTATRATGPGGEALAQAVFELDLRRLASEPVPAGDYQVYLVVGAHMAGPRLLQVGR